MTFSNFRLGIFFITKTLGITALALFALLLWMPKAHASTFTGSLTVGWGQPAVTTDSSLYLIDEGITVDQALAQLGQPVTIDGNLIDNHIGSISLITVGDHTGVLYANPSVPPVGGNPNPFNLVNGVLTANLYSPNVIQLSEVMPEVYYGSESTLKVTLTNLGNRNLVPYLGRKVTVEGTIVPNEYGQWECRVNRITVDGVEI